MHLYKIFSFSKFAACDMHYVNLKRCLVIHIILLLVLTAISFTLVKENTLK